MTWHKRLRQLALSLVMVFSFVAVPVSAQTDQTITTTPDATQATDSSGTSGGASSSSKAGVCEGVALVTGKSCDDAGAQGEAKDKVESTVQLVVNILSWIVGIAAVIMIIIGGFKYVTSSGDTGNVTSAKNTILFAVIGLVIVVLAQVIVNFVIDAVDKTPATKETSVQDVAN